MSQRRKTDERSNIREKNATTSKWIIKLGERNENKKKHSEQQRCKKNKYICIK